LVRRVYFAFHYDRDVWRANQVRMSWVTKSDREAAGFVDAADFEKVERQGEEAVHRWINSQLENTSVTAVLIGAQTSTRPYVDYEIQQSFAKGNGMLGVYIYNLENQYKQTDSPGQNPFEKFHVDRDGRKVLLSELYRTYYWFNDKGYENFNDWVESAAKAAGR
jgi:hypothetical protein